MKLSDYVAEFLANQGIKHAFVITGGCIVHTIDSIDKRNDIEYIPVQHEQAGAIAADCYSRVTQNLGLAMATSGPGATNLLTGVLCSFYDSVPTIIITGQVPSSQLKRESRSRQIGFQETDVVSIYRTATKYCCIIDDPNKIRYELEKAVYLAKSGRPGPVLLDICDDVQRADINPSELESYSVPKSSNNPSKLVQEVEELIELIEASNRPIVILGGGIRLGGAIADAINFVEKLGIPVAPTWAGMDFMPYSNSLCVGSFGVSSERAGNFAVQNSDLIITIGTRLDTHETGPDLSTFGREAKIVMLDIDESELGKFDSKGLTIDLPICADVRHFFQIINPMLYNLKKKNIKPWLERIEVWKNKYPICHLEYYKQENCVNPYVFMEELSNQLKGNEIIVTDCGANLIWTMQGFRVKKDQRLISAFNNSPMGYSVPASIGACFGSEQPVFCITGDGGLQMNIQELATINNNNLPIKIFVMNNHGYGIIKNTLVTWLESNYNASGPESGVPDPDFERIANAYGIVSCKINNHEELPHKIKETLEHDGPILCNVQILSEQAMIPKLTYGNPIEDSEPLLSRQELRENMIIDPLE